MKKKSTPEPEFESEEKLRLLREKLQLGIDQLDAGLGLDGPKVMAEHRPRLLSMRERAESIEVTPEKSRAYRSEAAAAIHQTAAYLYYAGDMDEKTMREFDESCLNPGIERTPERLRREIQLGIDDLGAGRVMDSEEFKSRMDILILTMKAKHDKR